MLCFPLCIICTLQNKLPLGEAPVLLSKMRVRPKKVSDVIDVQPTLVGLLLQYIVENSGKEETISEVRLRFVPHYITIHL